MMARLREDGLLTAEEFPCDEMKTIAPAEEEEYCKPATR